MFGSWGECPVNGPLSAQPGVAARSRTPGRVAAHVQGVLITQRRRGYFVKWADGEFAPSPSPLEWLFAGFTSVDVAPIEHRRPSVSESSSGLRNLCREGQIGGSDRSTSVD
jgi:hypothetical protein